MFAKTREAKEAHFGREHLTDALDRQFVAQGAQWSDAQRRGVVPHCRIAEQPDILCDGCVRTRIARRNDHTTGLTA
jgi:hypothetical protein